jgi:HlyD family secretion protein
VLLVPNASIRFTPPEPAQSAPRRGGIVSSLIPHPPDQPARKASGNGGNGEKRVWVLANGTPRPVLVTVGSSDGRRTEITGGDLQAGMQVITEATGGKP